jgi:hypothetical protein
MTVDVLVFAWYAAQFLHVRQSRQESSTAMYELIVKRVHDNGFSAQSHATIMLKHYKPRYAEY